MASRTQANETLLLALACGATVANACRKAGVSERTAYRRLADPEFQQRLVCAKEEMLERATAALTAKTAEAIATLLELQAVTMPPAVRRRAARAVADLGARLRAGSELEERIEALEDQVGDQAEHPAKPAADRSEKKRGGRPRRRGDEALITALSNGANIAQASRQAGLSERTVHRRLKDPEFVRRLRRFRCELVQRSAAMLTAALAETARTLAALLAAATPPAVRQLAARDIIELGDRLREVSDLEPRLCNLEEQLAKNGGRDGKASA